MHCLQMLENLGIGLDGLKKGFVEHNGSYPSATGMGESLGSAKDFRDLLRVKENHEARVWHSAPCWKKTLSQSWNASSECGTTVWLHQCRTQQKQMRSHTRVSFWGGGCGRNNSMICLQISLQAPWNTTHSAPMRYLTLMFWDTRWRHLFLKSFGQDSLPCCSHPVLATVWLPQGLWSLPASQLTQPSLLSSWLTAGARFLSSKEDNWESSVQMTPTASWVQQLHDCCFLKISGTCSPKSCVLVEILKEIWDFAGTLDCRAPLAEQFGPGAVCWGTGSLHAQQVVVWIQHHPAENSNHKEYKEDPYFQDSCMTSASVRRINFTTIWVNPPAPVLLTWMKVYYLGVAILEQTSPLSFNISYPLGELPVALGYALMMVSILPSVHVDVRWA